MKIPDFSQQHFLEKKANVGSAVAGIRGGAKVLRDFMGKNKNKSPQMGQMITDPDKIKALDPTKVKYYSDDEILNARKSQLLEDGTGSIVLDAPLGLFKMLTPQKWGDAVDDWIARSKIKMEGWDTKAGAKLSGDNPNSLRGKFFSVQRGREGKGDIIGEYTNPDGTISQMTQGGVGDRRSSVLAPITNTIKVGTPLAASGFVMEKFLPKPEQNIAGMQAVNEQQMNIPNYYQSKMSNQQSDLYREASVYDDFLEKESYRNRSDEVESSIWESLAKKASFNKIAELENSLEKMAVYIHDLKEENQLLNKVAFEEKLAHEKVAKEYASLKQDFFSKQAESEEFRLRTVARERSRHVVKLAEQMLENGLIKQAQFDSQVDQLMSCDESTLNLYSNMVKQASGNDDTLESLSILSEYSSSDSKGTSDRNGRGISKSGQTIGEAARYLLEKQNW
jgi:hypothetical protein